MDRCLGYGVLIGVDVEDRITREQASDYELKCLFEA